MVEIGGGTSLHLHCVGRGAPTVIMENGHGADGVPPEQRWCGSTLAEDLAWTRDALARAGE